MGEGLRLEEEEPVLPLKRRFPSELTSPWPRCGVSPFIGRVLEKLGKGVAERMKREQRELCVGPRCSLKSLGIDRQRKLI